MASRAPTAAAMIQDIEPSPVTTAMMPPSAMTGAKKTILNSMTSSIWICVMSLVVRVISEAVENLSNSALEKLSTRWKSWSLKLRPTAEATRDAR